MSTRRRHILPGRALAAAALYLLAVLACAVSVPPAGGPEDKVPPSILSTVPKSDSTGVDTGSDIRIGFSEPMRRERIERAVAVNPPIEIARVGWEANVLVIHPAGELVRDTTYVVRVKPDYQDRHGVAATQWYDFAFATGTAPLDTARIEGTVTFKRAPAPRTIVRGYRVLPGDTLDLASDRPDREVATNREGDYRLRYLPANDARFVVLAFLDENNNRVYNPESDPAAVYADTVVLVPAAPVVKTIDLALIDPREPGSVTGTLANETGVDTARVLVALYDTADSTRVAYRAEADTTGAYSVSAVKVGSYILRAFVDLQADSVPALYPCPEIEAGCPEPAIRAPGIVRVKAASQTRVPPLAIRREEQP